MPIPEERRYEFDPRQNDVFSKLAAAMTFVAVAMVAPGVIVGIAAVSVSR